jgi:dTDP-4-dehydrorhamnose reductase
MQKNILVVGSSGFLGRCITNQLALEGNITPTHCQTPYFPKSVKYDFFRDDIARIVDDANASVVIFAAFVEREAFGQVQTSMERFLQGCRACRIIYLSSDGIFDGEKGLYSEQDIPTPRTPYGENLLLCETLLQERCSNYCIIRPSYIYGFSEGQLDKRLARTTELLSRGEAVVKLAISDYNGIVHVAGNRLSVFEFHRRAMKAMCMDTMVLKSCSMPEAAEMLRDTSLDTSLWHRLTGMEAHTIEQTLSP